MPTYADLWNEQQRASGQLGPSNPVRLTISKGEYVLDPQTGRFRYDEHWEEEHLMEDEDLIDDPHSNASPDTGSAINSRASSPPAMTSLQPTLLHGYLLNAQHSPSLWVLDTNTLMSCLGLLKALFASLLTRNVAFATAAAMQQQRLESSHLPTTPSSIKLVLPYVVVSELDNLKVTRRKDDSGRPVAAQAREANNWLLAALQKQKRVPVGDSGASLSDDLWPLFVQPSRHYHYSKRNHPTGAALDFPEPDDEIIRFCVDLKKETGSHVRFCSDDINARTKAETDGIDSLGMRELANALKISFKDVQSSEQKWTLVADALIEQWEYQIGPTGPLTEQDSRHSHAHPARSEPTGLQAQLQVATSAPLQQSRLEDKTHAHCPDVLDQRGSFFANSEIMEVDMDSEPQHGLISNCSPPHLMTSGKRTIPQRVSPTTAGRGTNDSIHSPRYARKTVRSQSNHTRQVPVLSHSATSPAAPAAMNPAGESESLNPQIDWQDLVRHHPSTSRQLNKQSERRW